MQQGAFAGTGCTYDGDALTAFNCQTDVFEHRYLQFA